ncbi:MAG: hypothetical protein Q4C13_00050, partial [Clostridia bacterium]|nr:hypothetical protein [Clostridia bacterium]
GIGALLREETEDDCEALRLLVHKACVCRLHTRALGAKCALSWPEARYMRKNYLKTYRGRAEG